jgi:hypothetical protein
LPGLGLWARTMRKQTTKERPRQQRNIDTSGIDIMLSFLRYGLANGMRVKEDIQPQEKQAMDHLWMDWGVDQGRDMDLKSELLSLLLSILGIVVDEELDILTATKLISGPYSALHAFQLIDWALEQIQDKGLQDKGPVINWETRPHESLQQTTDRVEPTTGQTVFFYAICNLEQVLPSKLVYRSQNYSLTMSVMQIPQTQYHFAWGEGYAPPHQRIEFFDIRGERCSRRSSSSWQTEIELMFGAGRKMAFYFIVLEDGA